MLKNDMRKYIIEGKTFEEFIADYGERYHAEFSMDTMKRCWKNTHDLTDRTEWLKYLKRSAAKEVGYLTMVANALHEEGELLSTTRAGAMLKTIMKQEIYGDFGQKRTS